MTRTFQGDLEALPPPLTANGSYARDLLEENVADRVGREVAGLEMRLARRFKKPDLSPDEIGRIGDMASAAMDYYRYSPYSFFSAVYESDDLTGEPWVSLFRIDACRPVTGAISHP